MVPIDLNADLGEEITDDGALLKLVTSANIACGFHAGSPAVMRAAVEDAVANGVRIGAQVSYLDRPGFGRRRMDVESAVLTQWVEDQIGVLSEIAAAAGGEVTYVKPHGALYNRVVIDPEQAEAVWRGVGDLQVLGLPGGELARLAGSRAVGEGFPDRGYDLHGHLIARDQAGALVEDPEEVARNAVRLAGLAEIASVCLHGDSPGAVRTAARVREALEANGFELRSWQEK